MHDVTDKRKGWCPSVLLPMAAGDGLIVRIFAGSRALSAAEARAIAALADAHGSGVIELTRRANLQLRGVTEPALPALQAALRAQDLACASPEEERRTALLVSPLSELEGGARLLAPLTRELLARLRAADDIRTLPGKFGIVLDGDGAALAQVSADIRLVLHSDAPQQVHLSVASGDAEVWLGACEPARVGEAVLTLMRALSSAGGLRMREWLALHGSERAHELVAPLLLSGVAPSVPVRRPVRLGLHGGALALALPFGLAQASAWRALADLAESRGAGRLRIMASRAVLLPGVEESARDEVLEAIRAHGFISDDADPLLRVVACTGAPACAAALGETRQLARKVALAAEPLLSLGSTLHVSGCDKSCARTGTAELTVVHGSDGLKLGFDQSVREVAKSKALSLPELLARLTQRTHEPDVLVRAEGTRPTLEVQPRGPVS